MGNETRQGSQDVAVYDSTPRLTTDQSSSLTFWMLSRLDRVGKSKYPISVDM